MNGDDERETPVRRGCKIAVALPTRRIPLATLWKLTFNDDRLSCAVYRAGKGLEMRLETRRETILKEPFEIRPRMLARAQALRQSLKRRGWRESASSD